MSSLIINEAAIKVTLTFIEKVLTYRKNIIIPLSQVRGATEDPTFMNESLIIRLSGANWNSRFIFLWVICKTR